MSPAPTPPWPTGPTGPRTAAGKARSSMNALTHGLTANTPLLPSEDAEAFRQFVWDVVQDLAPQGPVQAELAHRAALLMWKRRRVNEAERHVFEQLESAIQADADDWIAEKEEFAQTPEDFKALEEQRADEAANGKYYNAQRMMSLGLITTKPPDVLDLPPGLTLALDRLARHEQRIDRQIDSTIRLLLRLQNRAECRRNEESGPDGRPQRSPSPEEPAEPAQPPPPAPAQNELAAGATDAGQTPRPAPWTGPPGAN